MSRVSDGQTQPLSPYYGVTVEEYSILRCDEITQQIKELEMERKVLRRRQVQYAGSKMLEAERRATAAEVWQSTPLPVETASTDSASSVDAQDRV